MQTNTEIIDAVNGIVAESDEHWTNLLMEGLKMKIFNNTNNSAAEWRVQRLILN